MYYIQKGLHIPAFLQMFHPKRKQESHNKARGYSKQIIYFSDVAEKKSPDSENSTRQHTCTAIC